MHVNDDVDDELFVVPLHSCSASPIEVAMLAVSAAYSAASPMPSCYQEKLQHRDPVTRIGLSVVANLLGSRFVMIDVKALPPLFLSQGLCGATTVVPRTTHVQ
jgi:hypothetical protein